MDRLNVLLKHYWFYIVGVLLLSWGLGSTLFTLIGGFEAEKRARGDIVVSDAIPVFSPVQSSADYTPDQIREYTPYYLLQRADDDTPLKGYWRDDLLELPVAGGHSLNPDVYPATIRESSPMLTALPIPPETPLRIVIPKIKLDAPIQPSTLRLIKFKGGLQEQWSAPDQPASGWHPTSALLGTPGNIVLDGHHNAFGEVFRYLTDLEAGDTIYVYGDKHIYTYQIVNKMILPELGEKPEVRLENARWIMPSDDERLTLVTCHPYEGNVDRLIIVAIPSDEPRLIEP